MEPICASIAIRASIDEALRRWSDYSAPVRPCHVAFESVDRSVSRVTVEAYDSSLAADVVLREIERHLSTFKHLIEGSEGFRVGAGLP